MDVTGAAGTPAYCSPEQANGERLTEKTDLWSWGLSLLAMFVGQRTWGSGVAAPRVLEARLKAAAAGDATAFRVPMPASVAEVLRRCFQGDPDARWPSHRPCGRCVGRGVRQVPGPALSASSARRKPRLGPPSPSTTGERRLASRGPIRGSGSARPWRQPGAIRPRQCGLPPGEPGSRQAQAIDDLIVYEEALNIYAALVVGGRRDLETDLATLCSEKAFVHESAADTPGAIAATSRPSRSASGWSTRKGGGNWPMTWPCAT